MGFTWYVLFEEGACVRRAVRRGAVGWSSCAEPKGEMLRRGRGPSASAPHLARVLWVVNGERFERGELAAVLKR